MLDDNFITFSDGRVLSKMTAHQTFVDQASEFFHRVSKRIIQEVEPDPLWAKVKPFIEDEAIDLDSALLLIKTAAMESIRRALSEIQL